MTKKKRSTVEGIKRGLLAIFKIPYWLDLQRVRAGALYLKKAIMNLFIPQNEKKAESFKEAKSNFKLSEEELRIKQQSLFRLSLIMIAAAFLLLIYTLYLIIYGSFHATILSFVVMGIALALAFRYHFWYFQIKRRKLGCSFQEWYRALKGGKNE